MINKEKKEERKGFKNDEKTTLNLKILKVWIKNTELINDYNECLKNIGNPFIKLIIIKIIIM